MRKTGILMPVSSLPSPTGAGELGRYTVEWLDLLEKNGVGIWQILPLNPVGYGNSPYQAYSSCAGDDIYISLERLYEEGLLEEEPPCFNRDHSSVDYEAVRSFKEPYLRSAFRIFTDRDKTSEKNYREFTSQAWVRDYGVFRALKSANQGVCWNEWPVEQRDWPENRTDLSEEIWAEAGYQMFLQYMFFRQWMSVKDAAAQRGICIMGDVPFYVGTDSADVWAGKENFLLDKEGRPAYISGVPPDYFSATGQRWGNPIYDWDYLRGKKYQFWVDRIGYSSQLFDMIRIDHFRAFDTFWKIPADCPTAVKGQWIEAPGYEVLDTLMEKIPGVSLVAEDLGDLRQEVIELKNHYHLKGMKLIVFSIGTDGKYAEDGIKDTDNMVIYTGTHDNDTITRWYECLSCAGRRKVRRFLKRQGIKQGTVKDRLLAYTLKSRAGYAIIPMPDILGLGKEGRINTPGTVGSPNWEWRMTDFERAGRELGRYKKLIEAR